METGIGQTIKRLRKKANLSQEKVAERLGVTSQAVSKWETGLALPDVTLLRPIADLFGVTTDALLGGMSDDDEEETRRIRSIGYGEMSLEQRFGVFREGLKRMPGSTALLADAASTGYLLAKSYRDANDVRAEAYFNDTVSLCNRQLEISHDVEELNYAKFILAVLYAMFGKQSDAEKLVQQFPSFGETVTSGSVKTAISRTTGGAAEELGARIDNLTQIMQTVTSELSAIKRAYARMIPRTGMEKEENGMDGKTVWTADIQTLGDKLLSSMYSAFIGDDLYYLMRESQDADAKITLRRLNLVNGEDAEVCAIDNLNFHTICATPGGDLWMLTVERIPDKETGNTATGTSKQKLVYITGLPDAPEIHVYNAPLYAEKQYSTVISSLAADRNGSLYIKYGQINFTSDEPVQNPEEVVIVMGTNGKQLYEITDEDKKSQVSNAFTMADGRVAFGYGFRDPQMPAVQYCLMPINPDTGKWDEPVLIDTALSNFYTGYGKYLFFYIAYGNNLCGFNTETGESEHIFSCIEAGVKTSQISAMRATGDGTFRISSIAMSGGRQERTTALEIATVRKTVAPQKEFTLIYGTKLTHNMMQQQVVEFNRKNADCDIEVRTYSESTTPAATVDSTMMINAVLDGDVPDIFNPSYAPYELFAHRGLLTDLYPFLDADDEINRDTLFAAPLKALEVDGKLYGILPDVRCEIITGQPETVGTGLEFTYDAIEKYLDANPNGTFLYDVTKVSLLRLFLTNCMDDFIDWKNGKTRFTDGLFERMLELCKRHPITPENAVYSYGGFTDKSPEDTVRDGEILAENFSVFHVGVMQFARNLMGENFAIKAYPSRAKRGFAFDTSMLMSISATCKNKDAAWRFIRESIIGGAYGSAIPLQKSEFEKHVELSKTPKYLPDNLADNPAYANFKRDENGRVLSPIMSGGSSYGVTQRHNISMQAYAVSDEDVEQTLDVLNNVGRVTYQDTTVITKITDDAQEFFAGKKTAKAVAKAAEEFICARYRF